MFRPCSLLWPALVAGCWLTVFANVNAATACPFCSAVNPTLAQQRDAAAVVAVAEAEGNRDGQEIDPQSFKLHKLLKGKLPAGDMRLTVAGASHGAGTLVLAFAARAGKTRELEWSIVPASETALGYFARNPDLRTDSRTRLAYFAGYLEHRDPLIAEDAYAEFAHASLADVAAISDKMPSAKVRTWLTDRETPQARKGLYGLLLGLSRDKKEIEANRKLLADLVDRPADDFRAGFDGILAGYVLAEGEKGLAHIEKQFLDNPKAADGDVRHVQRMLRVLREEQADVPKRSLELATRKLLARPEFAASAITDLARWRDWESVRPIAELYNRPGYDKADVRQAIVGFLLACPEKPAAEALARLRQRDPRGVADAEKVLRPTEGERS